ncbi:FkbM family methyltransferase [Plantactinospora siamensis]|uniref:FkbM family methyltransferase n=1 Tax=Plantactinospora siamensis TaxID=555372 RepID=A0ABV6P0M7_9ACTN
MSQSTKNTGVLGAISISGQVLTHVWRHPANRDRRLRSVLRAVSYQVRGRLGRPTVARLGERSRILARPHHAAAGLVVYGNPPDWPEMHAWRRLLRPGDLFVDVGSNVGTYALWAAESGTTVVAVEPDRQAAEELRRNVGLNGYPIEVLECALAAEPGTLRLTSGNDTMNHLVLGDGHGHGHGGTPVPVRTLDEVLGDRVAAGVKIDVEGAERLVLEGARAALADRRITVLQLEWNRMSERVLGESREPVARLLAEYGYRLTRPDETGQLAPSDASGYGPDVFAVAPSG